MTRSSIETKLQWPRDDVARFGRLTPWAVALLLGCGVRSEGGESFGDGSTTGGETTGRADTGNTTSGHGDDGGDGDTDGGTGSEDPKYDVGTRLDVGDEDPGNAIPETCEDAELNGTSSIGCEFFAVELKNFEETNASFAIVVANVQLAGQANVVIETFDGAAWSPVVPMEAVPSLEAHVFSVSKPEIDGSGIAEHMAFRVTSDVPIAAYQFNRWDPHHSSDASLLLPTSAWDTLHRAVSLQRQNLSQSWDWPSYFAVVAADEGVSVDVVMSAPSQAGPGVAAVGENQALALSLGEGDLAQVAVPAEGDDPTGSRIDSGDVPVAVFGGTACTALVDEHWGNGACDHLEEQLPGVRLWGTDYVAARFPVRSEDTTAEKSIWQVIASEDGTTVTFDASTEVTGVPASPVQLDAGEQVRFMAGGPLAEPGDFLVHANKPILVANYALSGDELYDQFGNDSPGDPAMLVLPPLGQYLPRYVVTVPTGWDPDTLTIVRPAGAEVLLDDMAIDDSEFHAVGPAYEVARIVTTDGVHVIESEADVAVTVVGYRDDDSYGYAGGLGTEKINPNPAG